MEQTLTPKQRCADILVAISWGEIARTYFHRSPSWLYHKLNQVDGNKKPTDFTPEELAQFKGALVDLSDRIRRGADSL